MFIFPYCYLVMAAHFTDQIVLLPFCLQSTSLCPWPIGGHKVQHQVTQSNINTPKYSHTHTLHFKCGRKHVDCELFSACVHFFSVFIEHVFIYLCV